MRCAETLAGALLVITLATVPALGCENGAVIGSGDVLFEFESDPGGPLLTFRRLGWTDGVRRWLAGFLPGLDVDEVVVELFREGDLSFLDMLKHLESSDRGRVYLVCAREGVFSGYAGTLRRVSVVRMVFGTTGLGRFVGLEPGRLGESVKGRRVVGRASGL